MSLKDEVRRINKIASLEKLIQFYNLKSKDSFLNFYTCPICKSPQLVLNKEFNTTECLNCGKRYLAVDLVSSIEGTNIEDTINLISVILNLSSKKTNETIMFLLWNMCDDKNEIRIMAVDNLRRITNFMLAIGIPRSKLISFHLERLLNKKFIRIINQESMDLLIYDDEKDRVFSFMRKNYNLSFLMNKRKKFKEKK